MRLRNRRGVTLIELILALGLAGAALLGGILLLDQLGDGSAHIARDRASDNTAGNAERLFRRLLLDARAASDSTERFQGNARTASYMARCDVPGGWAESCRITLLLDSLADSTAIIADAGVGRYVVRTVGGHASFRYLDLNAADSIWTREWVTNIALPGAIGLVNGSDTTLFPLGAARD